MAKIALLIALLGILASGCQPLPRPEAPELPTAPALAVPPESPSLFQGQLPIFDTHMHYNEDAWDAFTPEQIIAKLEAANVPRALVSSSPDEGTRRLFDLDPARIAPSLRPYHDRFNSSNWYADPLIVDYFIERLSSLDYSGIGEFHLHEVSNANLPVVQAVARIAVERGIFLFIHSDARVIDAIFAADPEAKILWAHAGLTDPPQVVSATLDKHENLWTDISIREPQIAPQGQLNPAWRDLFLRHPDRITIGSDTWILPRWRGYEQIIAGDRIWLAQLPRDVAEQIAFRNAVRLFGAGPHEHLK